MDFSARTKSILARIKNEELRQAAAECLAVGEKFVARKMEIESGGTYTEVGRRKVLLEQLAKEFAPALRKAQIPIAKAMDEAKRRRAALEIPAPDPANLTAALERQEIRAHINALPAGKRLPFALETNDFRILEAVLSAPRFLSGFTEEDFDTLHTDTQERLHGPAIAEISALESEVAEANVAVHLAHGDMQRATGLNEKNFADVVGKSLHEVPWLLREAGGRVLVVRPGEGIYPEATADDIARGKFYANMQEYQQDRAAA
jgi:hypothetical protein